MAARLRVVDRPPVRVNDTFSGDSVMAGLTISEEALRALLSRNRRHFIVSISFPGTLDQFVGMLRKNAEDAPADELRVDLDYILRDKATDWTLPKEVWGGDRVFWRMAGDVPNKIAAVRKKLKGAGSSRLSEFSTEALLAKLTQTEQDSQPLAGNLFAVGVAMSTAAFGLNPFPRHFNGVTYAAVENIHVFPHPVPFEEVKAAVPQGGMQEGRDIISLHPYFGLPTLVKILSSKGNELPASLGAPA